MVERPRPGPGEGDEVAPEERGERRRIDIVHESLLTEWPRLVRWQAQDEEGAVLRDQLRQAARLWEERGRPEDLLWTGTSFDEYELWRDRYPGGLSAAEEAFGAAMVSTAQRRRRQRRLAVAAVVAAALAVAAVTTVLWRESERARGRADAEALRAEASKLLALGRLELESNHTAALAYATKSLELADSAEARRFALEVLWRGPPARLLPDSGSLAFAFSPDGRWLATGRDRTRLVADDGWESPPFGRHDDRPHHSWLAFSAGGDMLLRMTSTWAEGQPWVPIVERWRLPHLEELPPFDWDGWMLLERPTASGLVGFEPVDPEAIDFEVSLWPTPPFPEELPPPRRLGTWVREGLEESAGFWVDPTGARILWTRDREVLLRPLDFSQGVVDVEVTEHERPVRRLAFSPDGSLVATSDTAEEEIRVFSVAGAEPERLATLRGGESPDPLSNPAISPDGTRLAMVSRAEKAVYLWDLATPLDGRPLVLAKKDRGEGYVGLVHPEGRWLASLHGPDVAFWPLGSPYSRVLPAWVGVQWLGDLAFSPDSRWLAGCGGQGAASRLWPLAPGIGESRSLPGCLGLAFDPTGRRLLLGGGGQVAIQTLATGEDRLLVARPRGSFFAVAFDASGRRAAAAPAWAVPIDDAVLRVWDLEAGQASELDLMDSCRAAGEWNGFDCLVHTASFTGDGRLVTGGVGGVRIWDLEAGRAEWIVGPEPGAITGFALAGDGSSLLTIRGEIDRETTSVTGLEYGWRDLEGGSERRLEGLPTTGSISDTAGKQVALDPTGRVFVVGAADGAVFVGRVAGGEPHLLLGHREAVGQVAVSPDGRWIASRSEAEIRLWPMPDLDEPPFHTLPRADLLARLEEFTNLRVIEDRSSITGWKLEIGPFHGWEETPEW